MVGRRGRSLAELKRRGYGSVYIHPYGEVFSVWTLLLYAALRIHPKVSPKGYLLLGGVFRRTEGIGGEKYCSAGLKGPFEKAEGKGYDFL